MNKFSFLGIKGQVEFNNPIVSYWIIEDVGLLPNDITPKNIYFCREVLKIRRIRYYQRILTIESIITTTSIIIRMLY
jgi:hypothetical protein